MELSNYIKNYCYTTATYLRICFVISLYFCPYHFPRHSCLQNFNQFDGESFEVLGEEEAQRSTRIVLTRLNVPGGEDVLFNYRLRMTPEGWQIIDIYLKGTVSELALRRSDFTTTLKNKGFPVLASTVDKKIEHLREEAGG